jgi:hypothetical protein
MMFTNKKNSRFVCITLNDGIDSRLVFVNCASPKVESVFHFEK